MTPEELEAQKRNAAALKASTAQQMSTKPTPVTSSAAPAATDGELTPEQVAQRKRAADALKVSQNVATNAVNAQNATPVAGYGKISDAQNNADKAAADKAALDASRNLASQAESNTQATQINNNTTSTANFKLNDQQTANRQDADAAVRAAQAYHDKIVADAKGGIPDIGRLIEAGDQINAAKRSQDVADINAQSSNGGVDRVDQQGVAPGIAGLFGVKQAQSNFTAKVGDNNTVLNEQAKLEDLSSQVAGRDIKSMTAAEAVAASSEAARSQAASSQASQLDQGAANEARGLSLDSRGQQQSLASLLDASARGVGPSAAQAQLQAGTDASIASALALAKSSRGGNQASALKAALMQNGNTMQAASTSAAQLKAQEQQAAQAQLGGVLSNVRGQDLQTQSQDLGAATSNAQLTQQTALANASNEQQTNLANAANEQQTNITNAANSQQVNLANAAAEQDASKTNLLSSVEQQKQKDTFVQQNILAGMSAAQAEVASVRQMAVSNAELQAKQEAARNGQTYAAGNSAMAAIGQGVSTVGSIVASAAGAAAASDRRAKKNITNGEAETRAFLKALKPHGFKYKDEKFGRGHHLGVMAQDVEQAAPDLIIDDTDGVKKIDIRKALSASLASLGVVEKRLAKLEKRRGR